MPAYVRMALAALLAAACVDLGRPPAISDIPNVSDTGQPASSPDAAKTDGGSGGRGGGAPGAGTPDASTDTVVGGQPPIDAPVSSPDVPGAPADVPADPVDAAVPLLANGMPCAGAGLCASGLCVDGVCCNRACGGTCEACNLAAVSGTCSPIPAGDDPGNECAQDPVAGCAKDGTCNGAGQCRLYVAGTQCVVPSCQGSTESSARLCDGTGTCKPGTSRSCAPSLCKNDSCASACAVPTDCQTGSYCAAGTCTVKRTPGSACTKAEQCSTGFCNDGVCCNTACTETCSACNQASAVGTCTPIPDGQDPGNECPAQAASTCGRVGGCSGARACRFHPTSTTCLAQTCSGSTVTAASKCNGAGTCVAQAASSCGAYVCSGSACGTTCTTDGQCRSGYGCTAGACVLLKIARLTVFDTANAASWSIQRNFQTGVDGAHPWVDWSPSYISAMDAAANRLLGKEWIKLAAASKMYTGGPQAEIGLAASADVYIVVDDRWGTPPSFTSGWTDTGWNLTIWETPSLSFAFSLFRKTGQTGAVSLPPIGRIPGYDYFVIVD